MLQKFRFLKHLVHASMNGLNSSLILTYKNTSSKQQWLILVQGESAFKFFLYLKAWQHIVFTLAYLALPIEYDQKKRSLDSKSSQ